MKYVSIEKMLLEGPKHWRRHFDFGEIKCTKYNIKEHYAILRLEGFKKFHQAVYTYTRGYLAKLIEMVTNSKNIKVEQTKSLYNNDSYDEFKITWQ
jgi:hypothetical protein